MAQCNTLSLLQNNTVRLLLSRLRQPYLQTINYGVPFVLLRPYCMKDSCF